MARESGGGEEEGGTDLLRKTFHRAVRRWVVAKKIRIFTSVGGSRSHARFYASNNDALGGGVIPIVVSPPPVTEAFVSGRCKFLYKGDALNQNKKKDDEHPHVDGAGGLERFANRS